MTSGTWNNVEQIACVPPKKHIKKKQLARLNNLNPLIKNQVEKKQSVYLWNQQKSLEKNPLNFPGIFSPEYPPTIEGTNCTNSLPLILGWKRWATLRVNDCNFQVCHDLLETRRCKKSLSWFFCGEKRWTQFAFIMFDGWLPVVLFHKPCFVLYTNFHIWILA